MAEQNQDPATEAAKENPQAELAGGGAIAPAGEGLEEELARPAPQAPMSEEARHQRDTGHRSRAESGSTTPSRES